MALQPVDSVPDGVLADDESPCPRTGRRLGKKATLGVQLKPLKFKKVAAFKKVEPIPAQDKDRLAECMAALKKLPANSR